MDIFIDDFNDIVTEKITICKGKIYKAKTNSFINSNMEYIYQERMIPMKRMSCPGCEKCGWLEDELREEILCGAIPIQTRIEHGELYKLKVTNISRDWESGIVDGYDLEFVKL